jgi:Conjugal transfer protein TraD
MARSLAERLRAHGQQKARLAEQEAKLKDAGRKARTRRLIEAGGLIEKTGLLDLDANALYGALLSLRDDGTEPVVLTFPRTLARDATTSLRAAGSASTKCFNSGRAWRGSTRPGRSPHFMAARHAASPRRLPRLHRYRPPRRPAPAPRDAGAFGPRRRTGCRHRDVRPGERPRRSGD